MSLHSSCFAVPIGKVIYSPQNEQRSYIAHLKGPEDLPLVWHHAVLPSLLIKLKTNYIREQIGAGFTVAVLCEKTPKTRKITIMTEKPAFDLVQSIISEHALALSHLDSALVSHWTRSLTLPVLLIAWIRFVELALATLTIYVSLATHLVTESLEWEILSELRLA